MKKIKEEIGRNHRTIDTDPIPFDFDSNIAVSTTASSDGMWTVKITVKSDPGLTEPARKFPDEAGADLYAKNKVMAIKTRIKNKEDLREYISIILNKIL